MYVYMHVCACVCMGVCDHICMCVHLCYVCVQFHSKRNFNEMFLFLPNVGPRQQSMETVVTVPCSINR